MTLGQKKTLTRRHSGFTLIELLIVIVVVAILAAISVVAYSGIQKRANVSLMNSDMASLQRGLEVAYVQYEDFPSSLQEMREAGMGSLADKMTWSDDDTGSPGYLTVSVPRGEYFVEHTSYNSANESRVNMYIYRWNYQDGYWERVRLGKHNSNIRGLSSYADFGSPGQIINGGSDSGPCTKSDLKDCSYRPE